MTISPHYRKVRKARAFEIPLFIFNHIGGDSLCSSNRQRLFMFLVYKIDICKDDPNAGCEGKTEEECLDDFEAMAKDCPFSCHFCAKRGG